MPAYDSDTLLAGHDSALVDALQARGVRLTPFEVLAISHSTYTRSGLLRYAGTTPRFVDPLVRQIRQLQDGIPGPAALACLLLALVLISAARAAPRLDGPFNVLEWADGVTTSRDGYAVWVSIASTAHRAQIPGYDRPVGPPEHGAALGVSCRAAGGGLPERFPAVPAHGELYLANHPEHPGVYQVLHPMHWLLSFAGRTEERWPVDVRIGARPPIASTLVRPLVDYSAPHPGLDIEIPGQAVLDALPASGPIEVEVAGPDIALIARFTPSSNARRAAALMRTACPPTAPGGAP